MSFIKQYRSVKKRGFDDMEKEMENIEPTVKNIGSVIIAYADIPAKTMGFVMMD